MRMMVTINQLKNFCEMEMKQFLLVIILSILTTSFGVFADEGAKNQENASSPSPLAKFAIFEGILAGLSWIGTTDYSGIFVITNPWAMAEALHDKNDTLFYTGMVSAEAMALYSVSLDDDKYTRGELFKKNMIAWHILFGVIGVTDWLTGGDGFTVYLGQNETEAVSSTFVPLIDGGELSVNFRF